MAVPLRPVSESVSWAVVRAVEAFRAGRLVPPGIVSSNAVSLARKISRSLMMNRVLTGLLPALAACTILSGAALVAAGHPWSQALSASTGPGRPALVQPATPRPPAGSLLQFRIVADSTHDADAREGPGYRWFKVNPRCEGTFDGLVTREENGKVTAVLVKLDPQNVTERDVERVAQDKDERGEPSLSFFLTSDGAKRLGALTRAHLPANGGAFKYHLAVIVDGVVFSIPVINGEIRDAGIIQFGGVPRPGEIDGLFRRLQ
jgi:hypothetical protein